MEIKWEDGAEISVRIDDGITVISANKEGLMSLSQQLADLAASEGSDHYHLDEYNSLEQGSSELVIEKR